MPITFKEIDVETLQLDFSGFPFRKASTKDFGYLHHSLDIDGLDTYVVPERERNRPEDDDSRGVEEGGGSHPFTVLRLAKAAKLAPVRDPMRVAIFLDTLFPALNLARSHLYDPSGTAPSWKQLECELWRLQRSRREANIEQ